MALRAVFNLLNLVDDVIASLFPEEQRQPSNVALTISQMMNHTHHKHAQDDYLFLGNPDSGKSTLINCIVGKSISESGVSYGGGLTEIFQKHEHNGSVYMDTSSLPDCKLMKKAAAAIIEELR
ncbi:putative G domain-containing protein [Phytophthora infestans]|uniref:Putative G domain-containing protein n=1 Tax=Phytophthora infestans TaxID=4787 RepID=A0A833VX85_PHYIN|nr:putative G domain-containing protein [Phytophthora infestans]KAF4135604.1 putative G domain-containing protein [Phytophthora infestans]KAF4146825.1 putative G domain-containing protein [Phytophthora infestans]